MGLIADLTAGMFKSVLRLNSSSKNSEPAAAADGDYAATAKDAATADPEATTVEGEA
jgi:hypothetical protein